MFNELKFQKELSMLAEITNKNAFLRNWANEFDSVMLTDPFEFKTVPSHLHSIDYECLNLKVQI